MHNVSLYQNIDIQNDIYFSKEYPKLYATQGKEILYFNYEEGESFFRNTAIKNKIQNIGNWHCEEELYDLETPYGYGGCISNSNDPDFIKRAFVEYKKHCFKNKVVAEFQRYYGLNPTAEKLKDSFNFFRHDRNTVLVELDSEELFLKNLSQTTRNSIKKSVNLYQFEKVNDVNTFLEIYYQTMKKNSASDFYFFDADYVQQLLKIPDVEMYAVKSGSEVLSIGLFFFNKDLVHYHLSGNTEAGNKIGANYLLLYQVALLAIKRGCKYFFLGGGRTTSPEDSLLKFKMKFSKNLIPFFITGIVFDEAKYQYLLQKFESEFPDKKDIKMFLKYRAV